MSDTSELSKTPCRAATAQYKPSADDLFMLESTAGNIFYFMHYCASVATTIADYEFPICSCWKIDADSIEELFIQLAINNYCPSNIKIINACIWPKDDIEKVKKHCKENGIELINNTTHQ